MRAESTHNATCHLLSVRPSVPEIESMRKGRHVRRVRDDEIERLPFERAPRVALDYSDAITEPVQQRVEPREVDTSRGNVGRPRLGCPSAHRTQGRDPGSGTHLEHAAARCVGNDVEEPLREVAQRAEHVVLVNGVEIRGAHWLPVGREPDALRGIEHHGRDERRRVIARRLEHPERLERGQRLDAQEPLCQRRSEPLPVDQEPNERGVGVVGGASERLSAIGDALDVVERPDTEACGERRFVVPRGREQFTKGRELLGSVDSERNERGGLWSSSHIGISNWREPTI